MKILIVDDMQGWINYHVSIINSLGIKVDLHTANSAREGYSLVMENNTAPYDIIITDMQMEDDFEPKYAGEWLIEQIKTFSNYKNTKIIIISATYNIRQIAQFYGVECIPKQTARNFPESYQQIINT